MVEKTKFIWMDGKFRPWDEAQVHVLTHTLHYGLGTFEGIRAYQTVDGRTAIFRLAEHTERLFDSAHVMQMPIPYTQEEINHACIETLRINEQKDGYIRPLVFIGDGVMGLHPQNNPTRVAIIVWPWGAYLGDEGLRRGIRVKTSSFIRHHVNIMMTRTKTVGNYVNSILAKREVTQAGYDEALLLDTEGFVAEASGENIFMVKKGILETPPVSAILAGITRDSIIKLAQDLGLVVKEERFSRDKLYIADEVFLSGTAAEVTPVREVDDRLIGVGQPGPLTLELQKAYFAAVKGENPRYASWLTYI
ncbi:MAG: branched chain amino acid aminotransferase [Desulfobacca sp. 4484_104]|nr:MAG: branched chain amino acid aminotransferase [Desulfobacca sp. 4484_104]RLA90875.1 MAG: branched chain amino acid aminotransferase [Deltaproteobacteria bacterium]